MRPQTIRKRLYLIGMVPIFLFVIPTSLVNSQGNTNTSKPTGVLRLRVRVKIGEATRGLSRKRFFLLKGSQDQNKAVLAAAGERPIVSRDCYYSKLGASPEFIAWLKAGDCESVYCREIDEEFITGPKAVREFAVAYAAGEKEFGVGNTSRKWLTTNLPTQLRDGFYQGRRNDLLQLIKQAETILGAPVLSVMTDKNGTAYFTDLEPGTYVLTSFLPVEIDQMAASWNCEVQIKPGDIATEKPYSVSNRPDRNVKCVAVEKPLPTCDK